MTLEYEDDPGAPAEGAYTADEKRARDKSAKWMTFLTMSVFALVLLSIGYSVIDHFGH